MNHSLSLLVLSVQLSSPYFSKMNNYYVRLSSFSNFFGTAFYNNHYSVFQKVVFRRFLSSSIVHIDSKSISGKIYTNSLPKYEGIDYSLEFIDCVFQECSSNNTGGAIYVNTSSAAGIFIISSSYFNRCSSREAGAIFCVCNQLSISYVCIENCTAFEYYHFLYGSTFNNHADVNVSTVFGCANEQTDCNSVMNLENSFSSYKLFNSSWNHVYKGSNGLCASSTQSICTFNFLYCIIMNNIGGSSFMIKSISTVNFLSSESSFENNSCPSSTYLIICMKNLFSFESCYFLRNNGEYFDQSESNFHIVLKDCIFDISKPSLSFIKCDNSEFKTDNRTIECFDYLQTRNCLSQYRGIDFSRIIIITLICLTVGFPLVFSLIVLFIYRVRWICPCEYNNSDPDLYCCCNEDQCCGVCNTTRCPCLDNSFIKTLFLNNHTIWESCCSSLCCNQHESSVTQRNITDSI